LIERDLRADVDKRKEAGDPNRKDDAVERDVPPVGDVSKPLAEGDPLITSEGEDSMRKFWKILENR
jgi:hypothetical protein